MSAAAFDWSSIAIFLHVFFIFAWLRLVFLFASASLGGHKPLVEGITSLGGHKPLLEGIFFFRKGRVEGIILTDEFRVAEFEQRWLEGALLFSSADMFLTLG